MKLTADRNEAPPKKKKKLKRKSKEKNQIQSPQRKPLIVDKVCLFSRPIFSERSHLRTSIISDKSNYLSRILTHLHVLKILNNL